MVLMGMLVGSVDDERWRGRTKVAVDVVLEAEELA